MATDRGSILTGLLVVAGTAGAFLGFAWPNYREASAITQQIAHLERRIATSDEQHISLDALATRLSVAQSEYEGALREIPATPDMAGLMRTLTLEIDRETVHDQTVTFGRPSVDPTIEDGTINVLPLTVDMIAHFEPVFELVSRAEGMDRLVRVASILLERSKDSEELLEATVRLEAIYEGPGTTQEVK